MQVAEHRGSIFHRLLDLTDLGHDERSPVAIGALRQPVLGDQDRHVPLVLRSHDQLVEPLRIEIPTHVVEDRVRFGLPVEVVLGVATQESDPQSSEEHVMEDMKAPVVVDAQEVEMVGPVRVVDHDRALDRGREVEVAEVLVPVDHSVDEVVISEIVEIAGGDRVEEHLGRHRGRGRDDRAHLVREPDLGGRGAVRGNVVAAARELDAVLDDVVRPHVGEDQVSKDRFRTAPVERVPRRPDAGDVADHDLR